MPQKVESDKMRIVGRELIEIRTDEKSICERAYSAGKGSYLCSGNLIEELGETKSIKVLTGLAKISLGEYGRDYHGLTSSRADQLLTELYGEAPSSEDIISTLD